MEDSNKRPQFDFPLVSCKKQKLGFFYLKMLDVPMVSSNTGSLCRMICLRSDKLYTFGRKRRYCDIVFEDHRVSKRHCQIFVDGCKILIIDGLILPPDSDLNEIRRTFGSRSATKGFKPSLNGVFVNGTRLGEGVVMALSVGDEVSFFCGHRPDQHFRIGFTVVENVVCEDEIMGHSDFGLDCVSMEFELEMQVSERAEKQVSERAQTVSDTSACRILEKKSVPGFCRIENKHNNSSSKGKSIELRSYKSSVVDFEVKRILGGPISGNKRLAIEMKVRNGYFQNGTHFHEWASRGDELLTRAVFLLNKCKRILQNPDPITYLCGCIKCSGCSEIGTGLIDSWKNHQEEACFTCNLKEIEIQQTETLHSGFLANRKFGNVSTSNHVILPVTDHCRELVDAGSRSINLKKDIDMGNVSSGRTLFLNQLEALDLNSSDERIMVSLPELVSPIESLLRIFIATFTRDVLWFLSCCEVPKHLPITIACHNTEKCWSSNLDGRSSTPYSEYPNLMEVYPPFPDILAFGKDRKKPGIGCHHPKLLVLQREDSIRVVVTSANLVSKQWSHVSNTVWWQDFPRKSTPDYSCFFHLLSGETNEEATSDFSAQLAGFMASLVADVPCQAHWISELAKYDFGGALVHLVSSIPGMHIRAHPYPSEPMHLISAICQTVHSQSVGVKLVGSAQVSVVGISHLFKAAADSNGAQLKALAASLGKCQKNSYGMTEVILRRNLKKNAVSVVVCDRDKCLEGEIFREDCVQLGFLPKTVAKWVAPLCDIGFFSFSAYIFPQEALAAALGGSKIKVQLILYVSQGPNFSKISSLTRHEHNVAICRLLASLQRCLGLWRLQEVLSRYKWPESLETDFVYGSSSIGSLDAWFLAAFSAATGKRSLQFSDSEESDPEWGRWNVDHELKNPSIRILFPTIERVKNGARGILPFKHLLSLSEKTWQRLRTVDIFHDAIPQPGDRAGHPMHVKVARRRFQSKPGSSSSGWIYCGSHNFSQAAWGRPLPNSPDTSTTGAADFALGSRIHICNYELGVVFVVPPTNTSNDTAGKKLSLDDIVLPFVVPAPKYQFNDRPATAEAMREALAKVPELEKEDAGEEDLMDEEIANDEEIVQAINHVAKVREEEKAYIERVWSQVDSFDI